MKRRRARISTTLLGGRAYAMVMALPWRESEVTGAKRFEWRPHRKTRSGGGPHRSFVGCHTRVASRARRTREVPSKPGGPVCERMKMREAVVVFEHGQQTEKAVANSRLSGPAVLGTAHGRVAPPRPRHKSAIPRAKSGVDGGCLDDELFGQGGKTGPHTLGRSSRDCLMQSKRLVRGEQGRNSSGLPPAVPCRATARDRPADQEGVTRRCRRGAVPLKRRVNG